MNTIRPALAGTLDDVDDSWWYAAFFIASGLVVGAVVGIVARRLLDRDGRRPALRSAARPAAAFGFWLCVAAGLIAAVASSSPETLEPIPSRVLRWLPAAGVAGLIVIGGFVLASIVSVGIGRASHRATGRRQPLLESAARIAVNSAAIVLALTQLGVDTTILNILVGAVAFGAAAALAGLAISGGHPTARNLAAGRAINAHLNDGDRLSIAGHTGQLLQLTATHVVLGTDDGETVVVPLAECDRGAVVIHST